MNQFYPGGVSQMPPNFYSPTQMPYYPQPIASAPQQAPGGFSPAASDQFSPSAPQVPAAPANGDVDINQLMQMLSPQQAGPQGMMPPGGMGMSDGASFQTSSGQSLAQMPDGSVVVQNPAKASSSLFSFKNLLMAAAGGLGLMWVVKLLQNRKAEEQPVDNPEDAAGEPAADAAEAEGSEAATVDASTEVTSPAADATKAEAEAPAVDSEKDQKTE